ncbi:MAG TPA: addiction module protein [Verrucomicrobiae bacterium]|nr:addiction module protein [Verrucomicrobiae bacterium]
MSATEVVEQFRKLSVAEQHKAFEKIREVVLDADELTPEQVAELDRRLAEFEKNPRDGVPWEQVEADLNKRFGWQ